MVEVTQLDRDAAADYMALIGAMKGKYDPIVMVFMDPICDDMPIVQAFAARRLAGIAEGRRQMREEACHVTSECMFVEQVAPRIRAIPIGDE